MLGALRFLPDTAFRQPAPDRRRHQDAQAAEKIEVAPVRRQQRVEDGCDPGPGPGAEGKGGDEQAPVAWRRRFDHQGERQRHRRGGEGDRGQPCEGQPEQGWCQARENIARREPDRDQGQGQAAPAPVRHRGEWQGEGAAQGQDRDRLGQLPDLGVVVGGDRGQGQVEDGSVEVDQRADQPCQDQNPPGPAPELPQSIRSLRSR